MLYLSENIKKFRVTRGFTQEDVAQAMGVSPQSVSKWERGDSLPDIALLPALANLFLTSVDTLLGMERINNATARGRIFEQAHAAMQSGRYDEAVAAYEEAVKTYPNDPAFMSELAISLSFSTEGDQLKRAVSLCEKVLSSNASEKLCHTTRAALCYLYLKLGDTDKAMETARNLPHMRESREVVVEKIKQKLSCTEIDQCLRYIALGEQTSAG
ncbi:MAG TPA: helix-turn-helix domain-containing protein [Candidatus Gallacutalibacter stercoravium]|nr:helix-turn-helix domain-containing protein [Candidatus Gallacutalibacter stercoravium]